MSMHPLQARWERDAQKEVARAMAIKSGGHKFIPLKLLNNHFIV